MVVNVGLHSVLDAILYIMFYIEIVIRKSVMQFKVVSVFGITDMTIFVLGFEFFMYPFASSRFVAVEKNCGGTMKSVSPKLRAEGIG